MSSPAASTKRRDDFKVPVKRVLAQRVGYLCSICQRLTIGPKEGEEGVHNIGEAAHIKAAAPGGPRYDPTQAPADRSSAANGIWACNIHAHMIDHDETTYTVEQLLTLKADAERRALEQLLSGSGPATVSAAPPELIEAMREIVASLELPAATDFPSVKADAMAAAQAHIETFESTARWPHHAVNLSLALEDAHGPVQLERLTRVLMAVRKVALISAPGTGKSTTMVQLAKLMTGDSPVPLLVPLGEWAETGKDLLTWVAERHAFAALGVKRLQFLAFHGEIAFLLDGWNEVPPAARRRLLTELESLEREYPLLNVVVSSRRQAIDVPITGERFRVLPLSLAQQKEIARAVKGEDGVSVVDAAWRSPGLSDLVSIPLYLWSLLNISGGRELPADKEELLRRMVDAHESDPVHAELFHRELSDRHRDYLRALAGAMMAAETTSLTEEAAIKTVGAVNVRLRDAGLVTAPPNPTVVVDTLVAAHVLVRDGGPTYGFQHQQVQEWFASLDLEAELRAASGTLSLEHPLVIEKLDDHFWGEAFLFACERMSHADVDRVLAVAELVEVLLKIDPLFAATLIDRSAPAVWGKVAEVVSAFARAWHKPGVPDRAVAFMIVSGRPEFSDVVWPLVSGADRNVRSATMRLVYRFSPSVIAEPLFREYAGLDDLVREDLVVALAFDGDRAGIDVAQRLALEESGSMTRYRVLQGLYFRGVTVQADELLRLSGGALADLFANQGDADDIGDEALAADIMARKRHLMAAAAKPEVRLGMALRGLPDSEAPGVIEEALADDGFSFREHGATLLQEAAGRFPESVAAALKCRVERKQELPYGLRGLLASVDPVDEGPIRDLALSGEAGDHSQAAAYLSGPETVAVLVERYLAAKALCRVAGARADYKPVRALSDLLTQTRATILFGVIAGYADDLAPEVIGDLVDLVAGHGKPYGDEELELPEELRHATINRLLAWARRALDAGGDRSVMAELARAMRRLPDASQVPVIAEMLAADLSMRAEAAKELTADPSNQQARQVVQTSHNWGYRDALVAAGGAESAEVLTGYLDDAEFGADAAIGLRQIWQRENEPARDSGLRAWPAFERIADNRARDQHTAPAAVAIFAAAERAAGQGDRKSSARAARLAGSGALLPHGDQKALLDRLMAADVGIRGKLALAQAIVVGGDVLSADLALVALRQAVEDYGARKWVQDGELGLLIDWLALLPLTDRPDSVLEWIDLVFKRFSVPEWKLRDILRNLAFLDEPARVGLLRRLAEHFPKITSEHEYYRTFSSVGAPTLDLLTDIAEGHLGKGDMRRATSHNFAEELHRALTPELRATLPDRFASARTAEGKEFIGQIMAESDHLDVVFTLIGDSVGRAIVGSPWYIERHLTHTRRPFGDIGGSYELVPRDVGELRAGLFDLTVSGNPEIAAFAAKCLNEVDSIRDREGGVGAGTRHPRIASGRPWPDVSVAERLS